MKQQIHFALLSLALFSLVFTGFSSTPSAFAHGPIDQINIISSPSSVPIILGVGQGFTPTVDNITGIDIGLKELCTDDWEVIIHAVDLLGPTVVSIPYTVDSSVTLQHIHLPLTKLAPGIVHVIEIITLDPLLSDCSWLGSENSYPEGFTYVNGSPLTDSDFDFATYFDGIGPLPDDDDDGVPNVDDLCPATPTGASVDADGCADTDGDGVFDSFDQCPTTPTEASIDAEGCEIIDPSTGDEKKNCDKLRENAERDNGNREGIKKNALENNGCN